MIAADYIDNPMQLLGAEAWMNDLDNPGKRLLGRMAQSTSLPLDKLQGLDNGVEQVVYRQVSFAEPTIEIIGMDVTRSTVVTTISDGYETLVSVMTPRRARHTLDNACTWLDEDGVRLLVGGMHMLLPDTDAQIVQDTAAWQTWYAVPIPEDLGVVVSIAVAGGLLLTGLDFYQSLDRLVFREHPLLLFPEGLMALKVRRASTDPASYSVRVEGGDSVVRAAADLTRRSPNAPRLQALGLALLGTISVTRPGTVTTRIDLPYGSRYLLGSHELLVPYDHTVLEPGDTLEEGHQFGLQLRVRQRGLLGPHWFRQLDWADGLSLDGLCPVRGITIPSRPMRALAYDDNGTVRVRLWPEGQADAVVRYQHWCQASERRLPVSRHLATLLDMDTPGQELLVDGLDLLFIHLWGRQAMVLEVSQEVPPRVVAALREHVPLGAVLVTRRLPVPAVPVT